MFFQRAKHHAARIFGHAAKIATHVDRAFGTAARIYREVAPHLAPLAEHAFGAAGKEQARAIHGTITSGISHYNRARDTGLQIGGAAGRIAHALNHP